LERKKNRNCFMPDITMLPHFLLLFLSTGLVLSTDCPADCSCHTVPHDFKGLGQLEMLDLSQNKLAEIPDRVFEMLSKLKNLDLSANYITHISKDSFYGLVQLERLYLHLDISINQLTEVPQALKQDSLKGLTKLSLAANPLGELRMEDFQKLTGIQELDLSGLNLQGFPPSFFQTFHKMMHLTAAENPFNCLCPLAWFPVWLKEKGVTLRRPEDTRCHFPLVNAGKMLSALEYKDFGCPPTTTSVVIASPIGSTSVPQMPTTPRESTHTNDIPPPPPPSEETISSIAVCFCQLLFASSIKIYSDAAPSLI
uniref:LRRCT domain-containing protein n=1 Tax=Monopterus albus TaxID=43700 RepID=A0A3Q3K5S5_MONAL